MVGRKMMRIKRIIKLKWMCQQRKKTGLDYSKYIFKDFTLI